MITVQMAIGKELRRLTAAAGMTVFGVPLFLYVWRHR